MGKQRLTDEILVTALSHIENVLNGRKLTTTSDDPSDQEILTPNRLLLGRANPNIPPDIFSETDLCAKKRWRISQALADQFWYRWMKEIIPGLTEREKWYQDQPNLEVGDIVVFIDPSTPRGVWPTGKVIQVVAGKDGIVRSAHIQTNGTERHRPVHQLLLIESVHVREGATSKADRRAGDVGNSAIAKTVHFADLDEPDLATLEIGSGKSGTKGGATDDPTFQKDESTRAHV